MLALSSTTIELLAVCSLVTVWTGCSYRTRLDVGQADIHVNAGEANSNTASETSAMGIGCCEPTYVPEITVTEKTGSCGAGTDLYDWREHHQCVSEEEVIATGIESAFWEYFAGLDIAQNKTRSKSYARCNYKLIHRTHTQCVGEGCNEPACDRSDWAHKPMCRRRFETTKSCTAHWTLLEYPKQMSPPPKALRYSDSVKANFFCGTPLAKETDPANHWWLEYQFKKYAANNRSSIPWGCQE